MSRVADRVGAGSFGGVRAPRSERGRAKAVAEGSIPDYELQRLHLDKVAPCPMNPRRNYGTEEQKSELGASLAKKQTTACVAVTREAYLNLWPSHVQVISPDAEHVLLNGERRYRSALHVGLVALDFVVRDDLALNKADFIDYLMIENEDRADFDVIERARGIKQLLDACEGNAAEVARRRGRDRSWVGNQVALLTLPYPLQELLSSGALAERYGRRLARALKDQPALSTEELLTLAEQLKDEERARREEDRALRALAKNGVLSADNIAAPAVARNAGEASESNAAGNEAMMLSADNIGTTPTPDTGPSTLDVEGGEMLSADNIASGPAVKVPAAPAAASHAAHVLSADNTDAPTEAETAAAVPHQAGAHPQPAATAPAQEEDRRRVQALGKTAAERARTLRQGCTAEELDALLEELMAT